MLGPRHVEFRGIGVRLHGELLPGGRSQGQDDEQKTENESFHGSIREHEFVAGLGPGRLEVHVAGCQVFHIDLLTYWFPVIKNRSSRSFALPRPIRGELPIVTPLASG